MSNWHYLLLISILLTSCNCSEDTPAPVFHFAVNGKSAECALACTKWQRIKGFRGQSDQHLEARSGSSEKGMCFVYPQELITAFTMKDVSIPLDLVLVSSKGKVLYITSMKSNTDQIYSYKEPARIALEFQRGWAKRASIKRGDIIFSREDLSRLFSLCSFVSGSDE